MKWPFLAMLFFISTMVGAQDIYLHPNEEAVLSFETISGKRAMVARDVKNNYMVYRFGSKNRVEFEYPERNRNSWKKFKYSFLLRGGGIKNEGMDLNYLYFDNNGFRYVVYQNYYARGEERLAGVKVINLNDNESTTDIRARYTTVDGSLGAFFRGENRVPDGEELFD